MADVVLRMSKIKKSYAMVEVLHGVDFVLKNGEVHALVGENGAGKSTLIKCLGGIEPIDSGEIEIDGRPEYIKSISHAEKLGISIIHQELSLVPHMTVAENIYLGNMPMKSGFINDLEMEKNARMVLDAIGMEKIDVNQKCSELMVAQQQMVEIARALVKKTRIIVMDEPTASLTERETEHLFEFVNRFRREGISIIYISHKLEEIFRIADSITVFRDGNYVSTKRVNEVSYDELVTMMVGREYTGEYPSSGYSGGDEALRVEDLSSPGVFGGVNFSVHRGEVLGFYGLIGSGRTEVMRAIFGLDPHATGRVYLEGRPMIIKKPSDAIDAGIALAPESRKEHGLIMNQSFRFNAMLAVLKRYIHGIGIDSRYEEKTLNTYVKRLNIKLKNADQQVRHLSGGNQQKVVLAKWLATTPKVLIFDEPTRGIDIGAKHEIYKLIADLAGQGMAIIFISSELNEVLGLSDNVVTLCEGRQTGFLTKDQINEDMVIRYAMGGYANG